VERETRKHENSIRIRENKMRHTFHDLIHSQLESGEFIDSSSTLFQNGWAQLGGPIPTPPSINVQMSNSIHATLSSMAVLRWIYLYYEKLLTSEVTVTQLVDKDRFSTKTELLATDPCSGFVYTMEHAQREGRPGADYREKGLQFVATSLNNPELSSKLLQIYETYIALHLGSNGEKFSQK